MEIKVGGFEIQLGSGISFDDFLEFVDENSGVEIKNKLIAVHDDGDYMSGMYMHIRSMKTYLKRKKEEGGFIVKPETIGEDESFVVINFFIINKDNGRGLYQYHFGSSTINQFCEFLSSLYGRLKSDKIAVEVSMLPLDAKGKAKEKLVKQINKKYAGKLKYNIIERRESFVQRVGNLKQIKSLTFDYMHIDPSVDPFKPLSTLAKRISHHVTFNAPQDNKWTAIKGAVSGAIGAVQTDNVKVKGIDPHGNEVVYKMFHDYDVFERFDYEDLAKSIVVDFNDIGKSVKNSRIVEMLYQVKSKPEVSSLLEMDIS